MTRVLCRFLDCGAAAEDDQVGERDLLAVRLGVVELTPDLIQNGQRLLQLQRVVDRPVVLRREPDASAIGASALVTAAKRRGRCPGGADQLRHREAGVEDGGLESRDVTVVDQIVIHFGNGIHPDQFLARNLRAEEALLRAHVAMGQLVPGAGERVGELVRILIEASGDRLVRRIHAQR